MRILITIILLISSFLTFGQIDTKVIELEKVIRSSFKTVKKFCGSSLIEIWTIDSLKKIIIQNQIGPSEFYPYAPRIEGKYSCSKVSTVFFNLKYRIDSIVTVDYAYQFPKTNAPYSNDTTICVYNYREVEDYLIGIDIYNLVNNQKKYSKGCYYGYNNYGELQVIKYSDNGGYCHYKNKFGKIKEYRYYFGFDRPFLTKYYFNEFNNLTKVVSNNYEFDYNYNKDNLLESYTAKGITKDSIRIDYE